MYIKINNLKGYHKRLYIYEKPYLLINKPENIVVNISKEKSYMDIIPSYLNVGIKGYTLNNSNIGIFASKKFTKIKSDFYFTRLVTSPSEDYLRVFNLEFE